MKNHAFLILAHRQPALLGRIVRILAEENHYFFIFIDEKSRRLTIFAMR